jgi:hypothetical protein
MKFTDLNPDSKWAIATSVITEEGHNGVFGNWRYGTGPSYLYDTGYQCIYGTYGGNHSYSPCYWNKPNPDDTLIYLTWRTVWCKTCDPSKTEIPGWNYWNNLGPGCDQPANLPVHQTIAELGAITAWHRIESDRPVHYQGCHKNHRRSTYRVDPELRPSCGYAPRQGPVGSLPNRQTGSYDGGIHRQVCRREHHSSTQQ